MYLLIWIKRSGSNLIEHLYTNDNNSILKYIELLLSDFLTIILTCLKQNRPSFLRRFHCSQKPIKTNWFYLFIINFTGVYLILSPSKVTIYNPLVIA